MSFADGRESGLLVYITTLIALMLTVLPLPQIMLIVWPHILVLVVLYWSTMVPRAGGMLIGFLSGLCLDVLQGTQMGQHALALSFLTYLAIRFHLLTRAKPIFEQSLFVLAGLIAYETLLWAIAGFAGHHAGSWTRWLPVLTSTLSWPLVVGLLGRLHSPR
jgi:rod shape-determining protein MreD